MINDDLQHERVDDVQLRSVFGDQRVIEGWVELFLAKPSGPKKALELLYDKGPFRAAVRFISYMEDKASGTPRTFEELEEQKIRSLAILDNHDERYYRGNLRNPRNVKLTAEGKQQLFLNGDGAVEIALRNVMGKRFVEYVQQAHEDLKHKIKDYNQALESERGLSSEHFHAQVAHAQEAQGLSKASAKAAVQNADRHVYGALLKPAGFNSGTDAVLCAKGILSEQDAILCGQKRAAEVSIGKEALADERHKVKSVANEGTRVLHSHKNDIRYRALRLQKGDPTLSTAKAMQIIERQAIENETYVLRDANGNKESPFEHAKAYFDKESDFELYLRETRDEDMHEEGSGSGSGGGGGSDDGSDDGGGRRAGLGAGRIDGGALQTAADLPPARGEGTSACLQSPFHAKKKPRQSARLPSAGSTTADSKASASGGSATRKTERQPHKREFFSPNGQVVDSGKLIQVDEDQEYLETRGTQSQKRRKSSSLNGASADDESDSEDASLNRASRMASQKEDEKWWTPYLTVKVESSFQKIAKFIKSSDSEAVAWRQEFNITYSATAEELLEW